MLLLVGKTLRTDVAAAPVVAGKGADFHAVRRTCVDELAIPEVNPCVGCSRLVRFKEDDVSDLTMGITDRLHAAVCINGSHCTRDAYAFLSEYVVKESTAVKTGWCASCPYIWCTDMFFSFCNQAIYKSRV